MDAAARLILGQEPTALETQGSGPTQLLTKDNLTASAQSDGWTGYPDYQSRFTKLWHPAD
ncbi:hypothetical protein GCM10022222_38700 [Amycolatopsis ultiminotia]|uniref:Uncharacterized protein n=1 Tax=Amycolatopsis ultiminotia TaxID=543629 RepID=A0ABP6WJ38_9PSEU